MSLINFMKIAIQDYRRVGALNPTSRYVAQRLAKEIGAEHKFVVEYGAGDGAVTKEILKILPVDGHLIAIEANKKFALELEKIKDHRLTIINGDVITLCKDLTKLGLPKIDAVVSGIPFSHIKPAIGEEIIRGTYQALTESGIAIIYQNSLYTLPRLKSFFGKNVRWYFEPRNFPPCFIIIAKK